MILALWELYFQILADEGLWLREKTFSQKLNSKLQIFQEITHDSKLEMKM